MVTATTGVAKFVDLVTKEVYVASFYIADVVATRIKWSQSGKAASTSPDYVQFKNPVAWVDSSIITGPTVSVAIIPTTGGTLITGKVITISDNLNTLATRSMPQVGYAAGSLIGAVEV